MIHYKFAICKLYKIMHMFYVVTFVRLIVIFSTWNQYSIAGPRIFLQTKFLSQTRNQHRYGNGRVLTDIFIWSNLWSLFVPTSSWFGLCFSSLMCMRMHFHYTYKYIMIFRKLFLICDKFKNNVNICISYTICLINWSIIHVLV